MNIFHQLENTHSKENSLKILAYIGTDAKKFDELMDCFFMGTKDYRVPQRAAHVVSLSFDLHPELIEPYVPNLISCLLKKDLKNALKRNILRILQHSAIPEKQRGELYARLYEILIQPEEEIAVRAFSMTVLYNLTQFYPELKSELLSTIEYILEEPTISPGIRSRGNYVLKALRKDSFHNGLNS